MRSKRERQIDRWRLCGAFLLTFAAFIAMLTGCASGGSVEPKLMPRAVQAAEECARNNGVCFFVHVQNDMWHRMEVRLNGVKLGEVEGGGGHDSFPVPESLLRNGRCASASVYQIGPGSRASTDQQCIGHGGYFTVHLDLNGFLWLTPWGSR